MQPTDFIRDKEQIKKLSISLKHSGDNSRVIKKKLGLTDIQFRDLFKPNPRPRNKPKAVAPKKVIIRLRRTPDKVLADRIRAFRRRAISQNQFSIADVIRKFGRESHCYLTGFPLSLDNPITYELDHFIPVSRGGSGDLENMRLCRPEINRMKSGHLPENFIYLCRVIADRNRP